MSTTSTIHRNSAILNRYSKGSTAHDTTRNAVEIPGLALLKTGSVDVEGVQAETYALKSDWIISRPSYPRPSSVSPWISQTCALLWENISHNPVVSGSELVHRLTQVAGRPDRLLAIGVWQVLLEESAIQECRNDGVALELSFNVPAEFQDDKHAHYKSCVTYTDIKEDHEADTTEDKMEDYDATNGKDRFQLLLDRIYGIAPDAVFRRILLKPPEERSMEELEFVFQELSMIPCFAQLPATVRTELSKCLFYEVHAEAGRVLFRQGDDGSCWYVIQRGSVWVHVEGQGYVCRLREGDDFGKLALITGAPRAATIVLAENNCHFLRAEKVDFDRILANVEQNIIRLREGDSDVLILERIPEASMEHATDATTETARSSDYERSRSREYVISAGTFEKILQHLLDARLGGWDQQTSRLVEQLDATSSICPHSLDESERIIEDFCLTLTQFTNYESLFQCLHSYLVTGRAQAKDSDNFHQNEQQERIEGLANRVLGLLYLWCRCTGLCHFAGIAGISEFLTQLSQLLSKHPSCQYQRDRIEKLLVEMSNIQLQLAMPQCVKNHSDSTPVFFSKSKHKEAIGNRGFFTWSRGAEPQADSPSIKRSRSWEHSLAGTPLFNSFLTKFSIEPPTLPLLDRRHQVTFMLYVEPSKKSCSLTLPMNYSVNDIKAAVFHAPELRELSVVEVQSKGEHFIYRDTDRNVSLSLSPNSCLFITHINDVKKLAPLPVQLRQVMNFLERNEPLHRSIDFKDTKVTRPQLRRTSSTTSSMRPMEDLNVNTIAAILTSTALKLALCISAEELLDYTLGCAKTGHGTPHVRLLVNHFTLIHTWTITQVVTCASLSKRATIVRKLIKLADRLIRTPFNNQQDCFAIVLGLHSGPVTRLSQTWDRVPLKWRRLYQNRLVPLVDPSRNHRAARSWIQANSRACIPFLALILKDLRFAEDANKSFCKPSEDAISLVNFEKMRMLARSLRLWNQAISSYDSMHPLTCSSGGRNQVKCTPTPEAITLSKIVKDIPPGCSDLFYKGLECVDDPKMLLHLSLRIEPKK